jgi:hypothetical protein
LGEAINGLAFMDGWVALSTRCEVVFVTQRPVNGKGMLARCPTGAHGVIATEAGYFVAPMGRGGVLVVKPTTGKDQLLTVKKVSDKPVDFYKLVNIRCAGKEVLVGAARSDGMVALPFSRDGTAEVSSFTYPHLDITDVCPLGQDLPEPAIAAISRDRTIILSRDAVHDVEPTTIKFDEIRGTAYRILHHEGNLLIHTSKGIYVLVGLSQRFLDGEAIGSKRTTAKKLLLDAVDINIVDNSSLLVVVPDGIVTIDLALLLSEPTKARYAEQIADLTPSQPLGLQPHRTGLHLEEGVLATAS